MKRNAILLLESSDVCPFRWKKNLFYCLYCEEFFSEPAFLRQHNELMHASESSVKIKRSIYKIPRLQPLKIDITNLNCKLCKEKIHEFSALKDHLVSVHNKKVTQSFDGVMPLKLSQDNIQCVICEAQYSEHKLLIQHMNIHYKNFICLTCGSSYVTEHNLRNHSLTHVNGNYACKGCDKTFHTKRARNHHEAEIHRQLKRYRCEICNVNFRYYRGRILHNAEVHALNVEQVKVRKMFDCEYCEMKFHSKSDLKDHLPSHKREKKLRCEVCGVTFHRKRSLTIHKRIHLTDTEVCCDACGAIFCDECSLKQHIKDHHLAPLLE